MAEAFQEKVREMEPPEDIPPGEARQLMSGYIYRGIGNLVKRTPQGEVQARSGDVILTLPGGTYVMDQLSATVAIPDLEKILSDSPQAKTRYPDLEKSLHEIEVLSSHTISPEVRELERARVDRNLETIKLHPRAPEDQDVLLLIDQQNFGGEFRGRVAEVDIEKYKPPVESRPEQEPLTSEQKDQTMPLTKIVNVGGEERFVEPPPKQPIYTPPPVKEEDLAKQEARSEKSAEKSELPSGFKKAPPSQTKR